MTAIPIPAGPVRAGDELDWVALERHLSDHLGLTGPISVRQFPHGAANLTYLVEFGATRLVVRRPPFAIAELHLIVPAGVGLGDLGRPAGFVERQIEGWWQRWQHVASPSCDLLIGHVYEMLRSNIPHPPRVSLVHGDLKLNNCVFQPDDPDHVRAIFDWDMTTLGDPLIDLGALLSYWPAEGYEGRTSRTLLPELQSLELPVRTELLERYGDRTGIDVADMDFYVGFATWKTAIIVQQLYHRYRLGDSNNHRLAALADFPDIGAEEAASILSVPPHLDRAIWVAGDARISGTEASVASLKALS